MWVHRLSHVSRITGHPVTWLDNHMDVVLIHQYGAVYWQEQIHADEVSAAMALFMFCGGKPKHRSVVSLAAEEGQELV